METKNEGMLQWGRRGKGVTGDGEWGGEAVERVKGTKKGPGGGRWWKKGGEGVERTGR